MTGNLAPSYKTDKKSDSVFEMKSDKDKKWKMTIQKVHFSLPDGPKKNFRIFDFFLKFENLEGLTFNPKIRIRILIREI